MTWCINFRKCFKKLSLLAALASENHVFPVIEQSGRCQLEINDGILRVVTLSQTREHLGIIIFIMCFVGDYLFLQLRTTTIPCSLLLTVSFFSGFTKNDTKESQWIGQKIILTYPNILGWFYFLFYQQKNGAAYVTGGCVLIRKAIWVKLLWMEEIKPTIFWDIKKQLQIVGQTWKFTIYTRWAPDPVMSAGK